ncbi:VOC family protein [Luteimonas sp. 50]|uniref:Bleomycin resistance protein n=1 Tax=Cognatiluteimonas sedimenti TaxID=2927791 RepID=A0ABT0A0F2_9GAMM|nr:VOC family protein [Lysobacter sedimenti]MCJ0824450.1 VOC family protein [Lysobacter sedimenti]
MKASLLAAHPVLMAKDVAESVQFYRTLGFSLAFADRPEAPRYAGIVRDGVELHIQWADATQWAYPTDRPAYRFRVTDVDAIYQEFLAGGSINATTGQGSPWSSPAETPWGTREFHLRDPGQNSLQFYQPLSGAA